MEKCSDVEPGGRSNENPPNEPRRILQLRRDSATAVTQRKRLLQIPAVGNLDPKCPLGARVLAEQNNIQKLADEVCIAVEAYLSWKPDEARKQISTALNFVSGRLSGMLSLNVPPDKMQRLFRISALWPNEALSRRAR